MELQKDLKLTPAGDLALAPEGDVIITNSIAQAIRIRIRWFLGEWAFNPELGLPLFEEILKKNVSITYAEQLITEQILEVAGVSKVDSIDISVDRAKRVMSVSFLASTVEGLITEEVSINA